MRASARAGVVLALRRRHGNEVRPSVVEPSRGGDRRAVILFPGAAGETPVEIVGRSVGGVQQRGFRWELPAGR